MSDIRKDGALASRLYLFLCPDCHMILVIQLDGLNEKLLQLPTGGATLLDGDYDVRT